MKCWKCGTLLSNLERKISFRSECSQCHVALHCCKNCRYYEPGKPNDCAVPGTEYVPDREANNFCEEFKVSEKSPNPLPSTKKTNFDDLFKA